MAQRRGRGRSKRGTYWDGIQFPATSLTTSGSIFVLVDTTAQEFMPATLMRIRGSLGCRSFHATTQVRVGLKIMYVEVNDAQTMTGDHSAFDTHEEDIAQRQLWSKTFQMPPLDELGDNVFNFELDTKSMLKLESHGKKLLVLLAEADFNSACNLDGSIRCLLHHG